MNDNPRGKTAGGQCPDELTLQLYLEAETEPAEGELVFYHLAHCAACAAVLRQMREDRRFCLERLGEEELRETEFTRQVLQEVRAKLPVAPWPPATSLRPHHKFWQRWALVAAVVVVAIGFSFWFWAERQPGLSAKAVLDEAEMRERLWEYQPGKVLHWVIESNITNSNMLPDGHYRTLQWRSNLLGQASSVLHKYDAQNQLIFARWIKADGTQVVFRQTKDGGVCTLYPNFEALRAELHHLPEAQRRTWENQFGVGRDPNDPYSLAETTVKYNRRALDNGQLQLVNTPDAGQVFRLRIKRVRQSADGHAEGFEMEHDLSVETYRRLRLFSRRWLADGRTQLEDSRWTTFREATLEELAANDLTALLKQTKRIEQVHAKAHVQKLLSLSNRLSASPVTLPNEK